MKRRLLTVTGRVDHVRDGDTIVAVLDLGWHIGLTAPVRLVNASSPELDEPGGGDAKEYAETLCPPGALVVIESHGVDRYARTLGRVTTPGGSDLGDALVAAGHAVRPPTWKETTP